MAKPENKVDKLLQARSEIDEELRRHKSKVTILFTDIVGSTLYFDQFGDTAGLLLLHRHDNLVTDSVVEFQGTVIKTIGDSVMAEFADPLPAVHAAIEIQERLLQHNQRARQTEQLQIRTGINVGVAFRRGRDVFGEAVHVAARITKASGAAQILVSESVRAELAGADVRLRALGKASLDGKAEPEELFEVIWTDLAAYEELRAKIAAAWARSSEARLNRLIARTSHSTPSPKAATMPPSIPLGRFDVLERVGSGGMGVVYKARDRETDDIVALKILHHQIAADAEHLEAFKNEVRLARKITHKNVCRIHDFHRVEDTAFISMEFVEGESLRRVLNRFSALGGRKAIHLATQVCEGLREAHAEGIVHRDLKPENLMIDDAGNLKVMDFGLAHLIAKGSTRVMGGTPTYMAPEQAQGGTPDERADIYSLGLVLFEIFTGSVAFAGDTPIAIALKQIHEKPPDPRDIDGMIPEHIARTILRCLEKNPAKRFQSVDEVQSALVNPDWAAAETPAAHLSLNRKSRSMRLAAIASMGLAAVVATAVIVGIHESNTNPYEIGINSNAAAAEVAAFRIAQSLNTESAWNTFAANYPQGQLAVTARERLAALQLQSAEQSETKTASSSTAPALSQKVESNRTVRAVAAGADVVISPPKSPSWNVLLDTVSIPAGVFTMGNETGKSDEKPAHEVRLDSFKMSRFEITNRQYLAFLDATGHPRPRDPGFAKNYLLKYPDHPVVNVSYHDAIQFCKWASAKFGVIVRLPTEAEWEYAARAGRDGALYPWGSGAPGMSARFKQNAPRELKTASQNEFPPNGYGLRNMSGNVAEWVLDSYSKSYYLTSPIRNPQGPESGARRVVRGGSWADDEGQLRSSRRANRDPNDRSDQLGFRVVVVDPVSVAKALPVR